MPVTAGTAWQILLCAIIAPYLLKWISKSLSSMFRAVDPQQISELSLREDLELTNPHAQDYQFARKNGCGKPKRLPSWFLAFGLDELWSFLQAAKRNNALPFVRDWHEKHGRTFEMSMGRTLVETIDPDNVQTILARKFKDFELGSRNDAFQPLLGQGIFASDGPTWEHSRALLRPNFVRNQVSDIAVYEDHVTRLIKRIPVDGSTVDLQELFFRMTMDSATQFLFGQSVDTLGSGLTSSKESASTSFASNFQVSQAGLLMRIRLGPLKGLYRSQAFRTATEESRKYVKGIVLEALANRASKRGKDTESTGTNKPQTYVFLHELIEQCQDETILTDQLLNILMAGRDSTAGLLSIVFFTLARREDVWCKLREEVLGLGGRHPSFETLRSMTYLNWVLKEILRLYPINPINVRVANKDTTLPTGGGPDGKLPLFIPKGREVMYSTYSMHRIPEVFGEDAAEFRPERWDGLRPGWAYIPFSSGPRICIGQQFALTEAGYTTVRILQEFEHLESRDPEPFQENLTLTLSSKNGVKVALRTAQR